MLVFAPLAAAFFWWRSQDSLVPWLAHRTDTPLIWYLIPCWILSLTTIGFWIKRRWFSPPIDAILFSHSTRIDVAGQLGRPLLHGFLSRLLYRVPGNQVLQISIDEFELALPRLPAQLDGFSIAQLTDLHFTGHVGIECFQEAVRQTNALQPDLIVITGDIADEIELFDWIPQSLAKLSAPLGVFFILGNHDLFTGQAPRMRQMLTEVGFTDLGSRWQRLEHAGAEIIIAGTELPWFRPGPDLGDCPPRTSDHPQFRLLLSHTPDLVGWARATDFDLMLAGHAHGGQICFPLIGPIVCPSSSGVTLASGTFRFGSTILHVSRGLSSELPLRINCPPELTKITLRRPA
jgi:predicted MPP superfamily phosphohydrolase